MVGKRLCTMDKRMKRMNLDILVLFLVLEKKSTKGGQTKTVKSTYDTPKILNFCTFKCGIYLKDKNTNIVKLQSFLIKMIPIETKTAQFLLINIECSLSRTVDLYLQPMYAHSHQLQVI